MKNLIFVLLLSISFTAISKGDESPSGALFQPPSTNKLNTLNVGSEQLNSCPEAQYCWTEYQRCLDGPEPPYVGYELCRIKYGLCMTNCNGGINY